MLMALGLGWREKMTCIQVGFQLLYAGDLHPNALLRPPPQYEPFLLFSPILIPLKKREKKKPTQQPLHHSRKENAASYHRPFQSLNIWAQDCNILHQKTQI